MRYREDLTFVIKLRRDVAQPLPEQIAEQIASAIIAGTVRRGARIPSTRTLAEQLAVLRGVVAESYDLLQAQGYLVTRPGSGTFVRPGAATVSGVGVALPCTRQWDVDLLPGQLCTEAFPLRAWRAAWRQAGHRVAGTLALPVLGLPRLRQAIAGHLMGLRGLAPPGHEIVVTSGIAAGVRLALGLAGGAVALQHPAAPALQRACLAAQRIVPLTVDAEGGCFARLPADVGAAVIFPDGTRPAGGVLSARQLSASRSWAATGRLVVQVVRETSVPLNLDPHTVVVGAFDDLLAPTLKLGYLLVPNELAPQAGRLITDRGGQPPEQTQLAMTTLIGDGTVARRMRSLTRLHASKRAIARAALAPLDPQDSQDPAALLIGLSDPAMPGRLREHGIRLRSLDSYWFADQPCPPALVLGIGHLGESALSYALDYLLASITQLREAQR